MTYAIVYSSKTGNTEKLAKAIESQLPEKALYVGAPSKEAIGASCIFLGFWTDKGGCDEELAQFLNHLEGKEIFLFGTAGFGGEPTYFENILNRVKGEIPPSNKIVGHFMCQGKMPEGVKARYQAMLEKSPEDAKIKQMIENFDRALSHPDEMDLLALQAAIACTL